MPPLSVESTGVLNERLGRHGAARQVVPLPLAALLVRGKGSSDCAAAKVRFSTRPLKKSIPLAAIRSAPNRDVHTALLRASAASSNEICCGETATLDQA